MFHLRLISRQLVSGFKSVVFMENGLRSLSIDFKSELTTADKLAIENKWKHLINRSKFNEKCKKGKYYVLPMFPYPSGNLHMGHVRVYTISDTIARYHRLNGKNVLHPIGFDSFGLPAENAALENNVDPQLWIERNIEMMRSQLNQMGCNFDWDREIITSNPEYYKFTQHIFLMLYEYGLVYRNEALVNWDPVDKTVVADEQVDARGRSWRSGAKIEKKMLSQWFVRTTNFAESLWSGLDDPSLEDWKDIKQLQKHWIGECEGANFEFSLSGEEQKEKTITVWASYPEHMAKSAFIAASSNSLLYLKNNRQMGQLPYYAINPLTNAKLPVYITDDLTYPTGCEIKLGLPCKNESDKTFAISQNLEFDGSPVEDNVDERFRICQLAIVAKIGGYLKSSRLRDWLISRQRRWGTPIPIVHCSKCGPVPVNYCDLPVLLPPRSAHAVEITPCPKCGEMANRETDTMDTFVDSSWYFLRYLNPRNDNLPFSPHEVKDMMPVDVYIGGKEHATLHLYYARFITHFLCSIGLLPHPEPFRRLLVQGMVMSRSYSVKESGKWLNSDEVMSKDGKFYETATGLEVTERWEKMSKSKRNGVEPSAMFQKYGVDSTRLLILAECAPTSHRHWKEEDFSGTLNWQRRMWILMGEFLEARNSNSSVTDEAKLCDVDEKLMDARNFYVKGTTFNYENSYQLSVAISKLQGLTNSLMKCSMVEKALSKEFEKALGCLLIMLFPMAPHFASELWQAFVSAPKRLSASNEFFAWDRDVLAQKWPTLDDNYKLSIVFKVNNAVKDSILLPYRHLQLLTKEEALQLAQNQSKVRDFIGGCDILDAQYDFYDKYKATLNIKIDHLQRRKLNNK